MSLRTSVQQGNTMVMVVLSVVVVAVAGFLWYQSSQSNVVAPSTNTKNINQGLDDDFPTAPTVSSTDDLTTAEETLDQVDVNVNASEEAELDSYLGEF